MAQRRFDATGLAAAPLDAAAQFHTQIAPQLRDAAGDAVIVFAAAGHEHGGWRLAAVQELARAAAPFRVNAVAGGDAAAQAQALDYLAAAPGVTGQVLALAGNPGGKD